MSTKRKYTVIIEEGDDGYYVVQCPALPGCWSQGKTREEALANIREAMELYVESLTAHGEPVPKEEEAATVEVAV
jgi:predicted RNase H-like HicB family nuclease